LPSFFKFDVAEDYFEAVPDAEAFGQLLGEENGAMPDRRCSRRKPSNS